MAEKEKYFIPIEGALIEVSENVYAAYYKMGRRERYLGEQEQDKGVVSYDALDSSDRVGEAVMPDMVSESMEDRTLTAELYEQLHRAIEALPRAERELIKAIYFDGLTPAEYGKMVGLTKRGVNKQREKILSKMKSLMNFWESF